MKTEVSTRNRGTRGEMGSRPAASLARPGETGGRKPAASSAAASSAAASQAGRAEPGLRRPVARPVLRPSGTGVPDARPEPGSASLPAALHAPQTRFILLVLGLLGGGLVCLLVINTTLATASFRIEALQRGNAALEQHVQALRQQVSTEESASSLEQRALKLGMRTQPLLNAIDLRSGHVYRQPASMPGIPNVPGYAP
jgi:hypothetical protein